MNEEEITPAFLKDAFEKHAQDDAVFQEETKEYRAATDKSLAAIHERIGNIPTKEDLANLIPSRAELPKLVAEVLRELFINNGKTVFTIIVGTSVFIGAIIVIGGGVKTLLGWIGYQIITK